LQFYQSEALLKQKYFKISRNFLLRNSGTIVIFIFYSNHNVLGCIKKFLTSQDPKITTKFKEKRRLSTIPFSTHLLEISSSSSYS